MSGWIKLHREIFDSDIWNDVTTFRLFIYLIGKASHQDGVKHKGIVLNKGQYVRSYRKLVDDLAYKEGRGFKKYSLNTIKKCVDKLIESERVNVQETELGTLFTIVNYAKYQHFDDDKKRSENTQIEEVRTNGELIENEVRTNGEQYQELKNLRIKEDITTTTEIPNPIAFFEQTLCRLSHNQSHSLYQWVDDFKGKSEIVIEAITTADNKNKRYFGFVEYLLKEWANNNLDSLDRVRAFEQEKFNKQKNNNTRKGYAKKPVRTEMLPDWFDKPKEERNPEITEQQKIDFEARKKLLEENLKKLRNG